MAEDKQKGAGLRLKYTFMGKFLDLSTKIFDTVGLKIPALYDRSVDFGAKNRAKIEKMDNEFQNSEDLSFGQYTVHESNYTNYVTSDEFEQVFQSYSSKVLTPEEEEQQRKQEQMREAGEDTVDHNIEELDASNKLGDLDFSQFQQFDSLNNTQTVSEDDMTYKPDSGLEAKLGETALIDVLRNLKAEKIFKDDEKDAYKVLYDNNVGFYATTERLYRLEWNGFKQMGDKVSYYIINRGAYGKEEDVALSMLLRDLGNEHLGEMQVLITSLKELAN